MPYYVDIPHQPTQTCDGGMYLDDGCYLNVGTFPTREEAIKFAQEHFGADEDGKISLVTGSDD